MATDIREATDDPLESEYGERYKNKCCDILNINQAQINKEKDMPYLLSLFERGDHLYTNYNLSGFMVYDNEKKDCTDEQLALLIKK